MCIISFYLKNCANLDEIEFLILIKTKINKPFKYIKHMSIDSNNSIICDFEIIINEIDKDTEDSLKEFIKILKVIRLMKVKFN